MAGHVALSNPPGDLKRLHTSLALAEGQVAVFCSSKFSPLCERPVQRPGRFTPCRFSPRYTTEVCQKRDESVWRIPWIKLDELSATSRFERRSLSRFDC